MCQTPEEIRQSNPFVEEISDFIDSNNIEPVEKLLLRGVRHNLVTSIQIKQEIEPIKLHSEECKNNPSLVWSFRNETGKVLAWFAGLMTITYGALRTLEIIFGLEALIKSALGL